MKSRSSLKLFKFWQIKYRVYAILLVLLISPNFYSTNLGVNSTIDFLSVQYTIINNNIFAGKIQRNIVAKANVIPLVEDKKPKTLIIDQKEFVKVDRTGEEITRLLKNANYDMGFISAKPFLDLGMALPIPPKFENVEKKLVVGENPQSLDNLVPRPQNAQLVNFLRYPKYNINTPIIHAGFFDYFEKNANQTANFNKSISEDTTKNDPLANPIQKLLVGGIVHLPFSPEPGEIGNSYIIGHSSNYSFIKSSYNTIFKPLESTSKVGEEFIIYDRFGRELKFRVFESLKIAGSDSTEAYKNFPDKRVVTLQTSILTFTSGTWQPTHRWLTRGELVV